MTMVRTLGRIHRIHGNVLAFGWTENCLRLRRYAPLSPDVRRDGSTHKDQTVHGALIEGGHRVDWARLAGESG